MKIFILKIYNLRISHYSKLWDKTMKNMEKHMHDCTSSEFRRWMRRNTKYGGKCLDLMHKKTKLIESLA